MQTDLACSLLEALVAKHRYRQPITRDTLLRIASYESHRGGAAKEVFEALWDQPFIADRGQRGIMLDHSEFGQFAETSRTPVGGRRSSCSFDSNISKAGTRSTSN